MYSRILVATDGSELAGKGVAAGLALAKALQAQVVLVTVSEPWQDVYPGDPNGMALSSELRDGYRKAKRADCKRILDEARTQATAAGVDVVDAVYVADRMPADAILETAEAQGADLVVMASHGRSGLRKLLLGSQTQAVLSHGTLPVLVVR
ncbi:MAG: universal stress protein [Luteimonas sp.]|nr:universal stress protein [Luteimonas sp.]